MTSIENIKFSGEKHKYVEWKKSLTPLLFVMKADKALLVEPEVVTNASNGNESATSKEARTIWASHNRALYNILCCALRDHPEINNLSSDTGNGHALLDKMDAYFTKPTFSEKQQYKKELVNVTLSSCNNNMTTYIAKIKALGRIWQFK